MAGLGLPAAELSPRRAEEGFLPQETAEAYRMTMVDSAEGGDLRRQGDPDWFANGAQIELHGLQNAAHLNGEVAVVVGFADEEKRYRVQLLSSAAPKKVARKNMKPWRATSALAPQQQLAGGYEFGATSSTAHAASSSSSAAPPATVDPPPSAELILKCIDRVQRSVADLGSLCQARQAGDPAAREMNLSDHFLRANTDVGTYELLWERYQQAFGAQEELEHYGAQALQDFEACAELYESVRSWREYWQDEINLTKLSIQQHGIIGTLRRDVGDMKDNVVHVARGIHEDAPQLARAGSNAASGLPELVRQATQGTGYAGEASRPSTRDVVRATGSALWGQVLGPVKRTWSLVVIGFMLCFVVPLFALRASAPLNSVVGNLGLIYALAVIVCPPRFAAGRKGRTFLLALWPLFLVVFPLALQYWLLHPTRRHVEAFALGVLPVQPRFQAEASSLPVGGRRLECGRARVREEGDRLSVVRSDTTLQQVVASALVAVLVVARRPRLRRHP
eukprot:TRINITY_DN15170_c0_g1_i1.p1 TRINITY_DN15170_c0_g1~~TRINITY_DN15170_c0_g1_i1.p1  ORF type:complete len:533 (-),score=83.81 TRINITY_DN15170_c0_g1_i1:309-1829(-)